MEWSLNLSGSKLRELAIHPGASGPFVLTGAAGYRQVQTPKGKVFAFDPEGKYVLTCAPKGGLLYQVITLIYYMFLIFSLHISPSKQTYLIIFNPLIVTIAVLVRLLIKKIWAIAIEVREVTSKVFHVSCSNLLCMLLKTSCHTSSIMAEKKSKWPIFCDFSHFDLVGAITSKVSHVSCSNVLCMLLITSSRTNSIMAQKIQIGRFSAIFHILRKYFDFVGAITSKVFNVSCLNLYCILLITSSRTSSIMAAGYCRVCSC